MYLRVYVCIYAMFARLSDMPTLFLYSVCVTKKKEKTHDKKKKKQT